jgi:hypothetical protein
MDAIVGLVRQAEAEAERIGDGLKGLHAAMPVAVLS